MRDLPAISERSFIVLLHDLVVDLGIDLPGARVVHATDPLAAAAANAAPAADA